MSISARDLGEEIGVTGATISNILSGRIIKPQGETCKKLLGYCQQYGIDTSELDWNEIGGSILVLWDTIAEYLIVTDRILIYSYTITGVAFNGIDNSVLNLLHDTYMVGESVLRT